MADVVAPAVRPHPWVALAESGDLGDLGLERAEPEFAEFYDDENGRPNRPVALAAVDFDLRWHYAFELKPEESHVCQKTLHNFRAKLLRSGKGAVVFRRVTDEVIVALGVRVDRQRLDSTHILSNFARLNRLVERFQGHRAVSRKGYETQVAETCMPDNPVRIITAVAAKRGVNLLAPAMGKPEPGKVYPVPEVDCPTGRRKAGEWLKKQEAQPDFKERYAIRAHNSRRDELSTPSTAWQGAGMERSAARGGVLRREAAGAMRDTVFVSVARAA